MSISSQSCQFLEQVFEAEVPTVVPLAADPKRVIHAEARIGVNSLFFADSGPDGGRCLPTPTEPAHIQLWTTVSDPEGAHRRWWVTAPA